MVFPCNAGFHIANKSKDNASDSEQGGGWYLPGLVQVVPIITRTIWDAKQVVAEARPLSFLMYVHDPTQCSFQINPIDASLYK